MGTRLHFILISLLIATAAFAQSSGELWYGASHVATGGGGGSISVVNALATTVNTGGGTTAAITITPSTVGSVLTLYFSNGAQSATGITDDQTNSYTYDIGTPGSTDVCGVASQPCFIAHTKDTHGGVTTITVSNLNSFSTYSFMYKEIKGLGSGAVDKVATMNGPNASPWSGPTTAATSTANELVSCYVFNLSSIPSVSAPYTNLTGVFSQGEAYNIVSSTGTQTCSGTAGSGNTNAAVITYD